eukprot:CAMPEP_0178926906 /NCGR_PEP_ID=MMETSP0786-20121207/18832_1 /TAXON_ID=186022 /ORGANISM="Thalassionema frauenfeldii, Strain CCMP 1798" /LENGTH=161 /DNA_ID=CAMNT_0020602159 /DNA_START=1 /DNA_END=486 /DNA_ORIENTATION=-
MGLVMSIFYSPIGFVVGFGGSCISSICSPNIQEKSRVWFLASLALLLLGCGLFVTLSYFCSVQGNGTSFEIFPTYGPCWSTGDPQYEGLGTATGLCLGFGLGSSIIFLFCCCRQSHKEDNADPSDNAIPSDNANLTDNANPSNIEEFSPSGASSVDSSLSV